jgi:uncharacterized membrane-anchored protein YhcB (DUF1043 family)
VTIWERLKSRPVIFVLGLALGASLALFLARTGPSIEKIEKSTEREKSHLVEQKAEVSSSTLQEAAAAAASTSKDLRVTVARRTSTAKDGAKIVDEKITLEKQEKTAASSTASTQAAKVDTRVEYRDVIREVEKIREVQVKISPALPQWRVGALVGVNMPGWGSPVAPLRGPFSYGGEVQRRILGPIWIGIWAVSSGQGGAAVELEF